MNTLGVAGLGIGLMASAVGAPSAMAQEEDSKDVLIQLLQDSGSDSVLQDEEVKQALIELLQDEGGAVALAGDEPDKDVVIRHFQDGEGDIAIAGPTALDEKREELYAEFTAALADELGIADADQVDAAIRIAMMSVIDARVEEGLLTEGKAEALKFLIATSDVPIPAMGGFGPHPGGMFIAAHGPGFGGPGADRIKGAIRERIFDKANDARGDDREERSARADKDQNSDNSDSQPDEDEQG